MFISPSFLKGIFVDFRNSGLKELLFFQHFKVVTHCLLVCVVSDKKSMVILILLPLYVMCLFSSGCLKIFSLYFLLSSLIILCLGGYAGGGGWIWVFSIYLSWYSQPRGSVFQNSQPLRFVSKFSAINSSNISPVPFSFSFLSGIPIVCMLDYLMLFHGSWMLCTFFFHSCLSLCFSFDHIY